MPPSHFLDSLLDSTGAIFDQAQISTANHRKNCVALHKLFVKAANLTQTSKNGAIMLAGEKAFGDVFVDMTSRIVVVKKGPPVVDRIVKFIGAFVKFVNEKAMEHVAHPSDPSTSSITDDEDDDTPASRFVARLLKWLSQGFAAKNKVVRFRTVSIVSEMIFSLGAIDEDAYTVLRDELMERTLDKESLVRAHAVVALSKLIGTEDIDDLEPGEKSIMQAVLECLCLDSAAEVRRAALINVPVSPLTLPAILTRTRDTDPIMRKLVYASVLMKKVEHPRQLTIADREQVVRDGLGDREDAVRIAAGKVLGVWFDMVQVDGDNGTEKPSDSMTQGLVRFLEIFDVIGPGEQIATDALLSVFMTRMDVLDSMCFTKEFWDNLSPESALLARTFIEHCVSADGQGRLDASALPEVTAFAFLVQEAFNQLLGVIEEDEEARLLGNEEDMDEENQDRREEQRTQREFILSELLKSAVHLDYTDEVGRRKLLVVIRELLAHAYLPEILIERCLDVLKVIVHGERELIRLSVEAILDLRDEVEKQAAGDSQLINDESELDLTQMTINRERSMRRTKEARDMTPEEKIQADAVDVRCLSICIATLERVNCSFEDNSVLEGILADLIIPAVKRKESLLREKGLISLGLCCLIAKNMALSSFQLFLSQVQGAPEGLKLKVLQVVFDLLMVYDKEFFGRSEDVAERILTFLLQTLEYEESVAVQAVISMGISKLLLCGVVTDTRVLTSLVLAYVSPATAENLELRQCLSYFFPVYCYSYPLHQSRMQSIFITAYDLITRVFEDLEDDQEMISPYQFGLLFIDWTNPQKAAKMEDTNVVSRDVHVDLAIDILKALYDSDRSDEDQKTLSQLLGHLYVPDDLETSSMLKLDILVSHLQEQCPLENSAIAKLFERFKIRFMKQFSGRLGKIHRQEYICTDDFVQLYEYIGVGIPKYEDPPVSDAEVAGESDVEPPPVEAPPERGR
ncbi:hypothetical protein SERLA73DRAFT_102367 [Serpula lacrymans var. lacrymans S7.3]|uniref:Nuclear condensin complex subunit 3 C-terminal domain-containing protein n=1 Tax=Serpula lacrymans var. lacrymans (strain S7.3) TaxID=936435 RepID=F8PLA0_SERL3|nr:hypothetical protein SERLA73DRAFT_102367 [Serpula lacrymans var. lacrymans S7.3]